VGRFPELTPVRSQTTTRGFLPWMPVTRINRLEIMFLDEASDLVFKVTDLDLVSLVAGVDGADETHNDGS